jgi:hypothetical protein
MSVICFVGPQGFWVGACAEAAVASQKIITITIVRRKQPIATALSLDWWLMANPP